MQDLEELSASAAMPRAKRHRMRAFSRWIRRWGPLILLAWILVEVQDANEQFKAMRNWMTASERRQVAIDDWLSEIHRAIEDVVEKVQALDR